MVFSKNDSSLQGYSVTSAGEDSHGAQVVIITCGYLEEHFGEFGLKKAGTKCDRFGR